MCCQLKSVWNRTACNDIIFNVISAGLWGEIGSLRFTIQDPVANDFSFALLTVKVVYCLLDARMWYNIILCLLSINLLGIVPAVQQRALHYRNNSCAAELAISPLNHLCDVICAVGRKCADPVLRFKRQLPTGY